MEEPLRDHVREVGESWAEAPYYAEAESHMDGQWRDLIYPAIRHCDFSRVLELAPGHGRNTAKLIELAGELHLVDVNASCIEACRRRFADHPRARRVRYHVNDGRTLSAIADGSITFAYCWDAMVHFERPLVRAYLAELARVLVPGGHAALHYSNHRALHDGPDRPWRENPHWRSEMSQELFHRYCGEAGLAIDLEDRLGWGGIAELDATALVRKTG